MRASVLLGSLCLLLFVTGLCWGGTTIRIPPRAAMAAIGTNLPEVPVPPVHAPRSGLLLELLHSAPFAAGTWTDSSGNGNNAVQGNPTYYPNVMGGGGVQFATGTCLHCPGVVFAGGGGAPVVTTVANVILKTPTGTLGFLVDGYSGGNRPYIFTNGGIFAATRPTQTDVTYVATFSTLQVQWIIQTTPASYTRVWFKGVEQTATGNVNGGNLVVNGINIGNYDDNQPYAFGFGNQIVDLWVYNRALTPTEFSTAPTWQ